MTTTTIHGGLPEGIRDRNGVFAETKSAEASARERLQQARTKVAELKRAHAQAIGVLREGTDANDGSADLNLAAGQVRDYARQLERVEAELEQWESVNAQIEKADRERRFHEVVAQAQRAREKLKEHYRDAALALGEWYGLGEEARQLASVLCDHLPQGTIYYPPELKRALAALETNPDPRLELLEQYKEISTFQSWKRQMPLIPLIAKEK